MKYIVQVRKDERWIAVGPPQSVKTKAFDKLDKVLESGLYDRVRIVVLDPDERPLDLVE